MYKCNNCGAEFTDPDFYDENIGEFWGTPAYQKFETCPQCGSDDFEEVEEK